MATLTKSTGTVTLSGAVEKVTLPAVYGWVWVKNMSDADMFVGLSDGISAGADGVMRIPAGECGRVQTDGQDSVYLIGSGNALVVAQNYADCPFKVGGKGGEIPDLSAYAKKADVPNIKVNEAVNADTVGGLNPDVFSKAKIMATDIFGVTDQYGNLKLWSSPESKQPICAKFNKICALPCLTTDSDGFYYYYLALMNADTHDYIPNTAVSGTVFYINIGEVIT